MSGSPSNVDSPSDGQKKGVMSKVHLYHGSLEERVDEILSNRSATRNPNIDTGCVDTSMEEVHLNARRPKNESQPPSPRLSSSSSVKSESQSDRVGDEMDLDCDGGLKVESIPLVIASAVQPGEDGGAEMPASVIAQQVKLRQFEMEQKSKRMSFVIPTIDKDVRAYLRKIGDPVSLFGEGAYERRERLRMSLTRSEIDKPKESEAVEVPKFTPKEERPTDDDVQVGPDDVWYSEGSVLLFRCRKFLLDWSLQRARQRLTQQKKLRQRMTRSAYDLKLQNIKGKMADLLDAPVSQVGDDRPLTSGRFSPDSCRFATCGWSGIVKVWGVPSCRLITSLTGHNDRVHSIAWRPLIGTYGQSSVEADEKQQHNRVNGSRSSNSANGSSSSPVSSEVKTCIKEDGEDGGKMEEIYKGGQEGETVRDRSECREPGEKLEEELDYNHYYSNLPTDAVDLASCDAEANICLWNTRTGRIRAHLDGHEDRVNRVAFHPCADYLVSSSMDETWRLWDLETQEEILCQECDYSGIYAIDCHIDGALVVTGDINGMIRVWDLRSGNCVMPLLGHIRQVLSVSCERSRGFEFASASDDRSVRIWDIRQRKTVKQVIGHSKLVSECLYGYESGAYLMSASFDCQIKLWSTLDYRCVKVLRGNESRVMGADVSPNGKHVASVSFDRTWKLWCADEEKAKQRLQDDIDSDSDSDSDDTNHLVPVETTRPHCGGDADATGKPPIVINRLPKRRTSGAEGNDISLYVEQIVNECLSGDDEYMSAEDTPYTHDNVSD